jgi:hypothetical protein
VVVDHTDFKVGGFKVRDVTIQSDRTKGILKGEPKQLALKMLYDRESHHTGILRRYISFKGCIGI